LDAASYHALDATIVPRDEWFPGYHDRVTYSTAAVTPRSASDLSHVSVVELDITLLFHKFAQPPFWIFPAEGDAVKPHLWYPELITVANTRTLLDDEPWQNLSSMAAPVSFDISGWFEMIAKKYLELEDEHRQSIHPCFPDQFAAPKAGSLLR